MRSFCQDIFSFSFIYFVWNHGIIFPGVFFFFFSFNFFFLLVKKKFHETPQEFKKIALTFFPKLHSHFFFSLVTWFNTQKGFFKYFFLSWNFFLLVWNQEGFFFSFFWSGWKKYIQLQKADFSKRFTRYHRFHITFFCQLKKIVCEKCETNWKACFSRRIF